MSDITLEAIDAKQTELAEMNAKFKAEAPRALAVAVITIELRAGEHYAGAVLNEDGTIKHHLVVMAARPSKRLTWAGAIAWAKDAGGELPTRQEAALVFANCKPHVPADWHWTSEEHENASCAWYCGFSTGYQGNVFHKSYEGLAVAVRRF